MSAIMQHYNGFGITDVNQSRPYIAEDGRAYVTTFAGGKPQATEVPELRTNGLLRKDEWEALDTYVVQEATRRLNAVQDLRNAGLVLNLGGLGVSISQFETASDMTDAEQHMAAGTPTTADRISHNLNSVPVPITSKDFSIDLRSLEASRRAGTPTGGATPLDITHATQSARLVAEKLEASVFNGTDVTVNGAPGYGYLTHPNRITESMTAPWATAGTTADQIETDFRTKILDPLMDNRYGLANGEVCIYVDVASYQNLRKPFGDDKNKTLLMYLTEMFPVVKKIDVSYFLPTNKVVAVAMIRDVVDLAVGQDVTTVQWSNNGNLSTNFKVMAAMVARVKSDAAGRSGIVELSAA